MKNKIYVIKSKGTGWNNFVREEGSVENENQWINFTWRPKKGAVNEYLLQAIVILSFHEQFFSFSLMVNKMWVMWAIKYYLYRYKFLFSTDENYFYSWPTKSGFHEMLGGWEKNYIYMNSFMLDKVTTIKGCRLQITAGAHTPISRCSVLNNEIRNFHFFVINCSLLCVFHYQPYELMKLNCDINFFYMQIDVWKNY